VGKCVRGGNPCRLVTTLTWNGTEAACLSQDVGQLYAAAVRGAASLRVTSITVKEDRKGRPAGLNTVELLKVASSALNIGPHHAMQVTARNQGLKARLWGQLLARRQARLVMQLNSTCCVP